MYNEDYYQLLNVAPNATEGEIKASFIKMRQNDSQENIQKLTEAYKILSDANERTKYDQWYAKRNQSSSSGTNFGGAQRTNSNGASSTNSVCQIKVLNLDNFTTRITNANIDTTRFPPSQYCDNGLYYAVEKNNNISLCDKGQWENINRQIVMAVARARNKPKLNSNAIGKLVMGVILLIVFIAAVSQCGNEKTNNTTSNNTSYTGTTGITPDVTKEPEIEYEEVEKPANGTVSHKYDPYSGDTSILKIQLPSYDTSKYYYIKLVEPTTGDIVQSVFLYPGESKEIYVPCGNFQLRYACGDKWYGYEHLFGPYGGYSKSDEMLDFTPEYGHTITLYPVANGNFSTDSIDFDEF